MKALQATALLAGTIIGAGMFALPYAASQSGFFIAFLWLLVVSVAMTLVHLMYGEVLLSTPERHRLSGYAEKFIGIGASRLVLGTELAGLLATMLIYVVLGATFLGTVVPGHLSPALLAILAWIIFTVPELFGLRALSRLELVLTFLLVGAIAGISIFLLPHVRTEFLGGVHFSQALLPYGVTLFSLSGIAAIPLVRERLDNNTSAMRTVILVGTAVPAVLFALFMFAVVGTTGSNTSPEAIAGLAQVFGHPLLVVGALAGFLAVATSYVSLATYVRDELELDAHLPKPFALAVLALPLGAYMLGAHNFVFIAAIVGTVIGAVDGSLIALIWRRARQSSQDVMGYRTPFPRVGAFVIMALFVGAAAVQVVVALVHTL